MAQGDETIFSREIQIFADQVQEIEQAVSDVISLRELDNATGKTLEYVGEIVGITRPVGMTDNNYIKLIKAKIQMNSSGGEPERLIAALKALTGATNVSYYESLYLACLDFTGVSVIDNLWNFMKALVAGGVDLRLNYVDSVTPFTFDSDTNGLDNGLLGGLVT